MRWTPLLAVLVWVSAACDGGAGETVNATLNLAEAMGGADTAGYARALEPRPFVFPDDHGPHPDFRTEWWYVTTNLETAEGRRFGVQFTLFRSALAPEPQVAGVQVVSEGGVDSGAEVSPDAATDELATRQIYMGHFALTDVAGDGFYESERFTRSAGGLAGGVADPLRIWMDDWSLQSGGEADPDAPASGAVFPLRMRANQPEVSVDLELEPLRPMVLQGDRGLSQKGPEPGNASFYYSFTRLAAAGQVTVNGEVFTVSGTAWLDREWSTSALSDGQEGWDWFALQLDDGRDLMVYRLRRDDGSTDPLSEGVLVGPDGTVERLTSEEFALEAVSMWTSELDGTVYPSTWRVTVPSRELDLEVEPVRRDQELNVTVRYWEGAVDVSGSASGRGYVELTGYGPESGAGQSRFKPGA